MRLVSHILLASAVLASISPGRNQAQATPVATPTATAVPVARQNIYVQQSIDLPGARQALSDQASILVPGVGADPNAMSQLAADLLVMCRVFDKTVQRARPELFGSGLYDDPFRNLMLPAPSSALQRFLNPNDQQTRALYIKGYGALFTINVRFALKPSPAKTDPLAAEQVDPIWAETRQEIFEPRKSQEESEEPPYEPVLVDQLKRQIKSTLRHAANIRAMGSDEYITVVVRRLGATSDPSIATLTLRIGKTDVDACAAGALSAEAFATKVQVIES